MKNSVNKIKVANIIEDGRLAGPQLRMIRVASKIQDNQVSTTLIIPTENSEEFKYLCKKMNVKYLLSPLTNLRSNFVVFLKYVFLFPIEVFLLVKLLKENKFNILHVSGGSWQYKGVLAAKISRIKVIWHLNDTFSPLPLRIFFCL